MRKWLIILLVAQIGSVPVFRGGILGELFKLKSIVEHFQIHKELESGISMIDFIAMHYGDANNHRGAHDHHDSFPFQKCSCSFSALIAILPSAEKSMSTHQIEGVRVFCLRTIDDRIRSFNGDIWLPPKLG